MTRARFLIGAVAKTPRPCTGDLRTFRCLKTAARGRVRCFLVVDRVGTIEFRISKVARMEQGARRWELGDGRSEPGAGGDGQSPADRRNLCVMTTKLQLKGE